MVKYSRWVQQNDNTDFFLIHGADYVILNGKECSFSGIVFEVSRLEDKVQVVVSEVGAQAISKYFFKILQAISN